MPPSTRAGAAALLGALITACGGGASSAATSCPPTPRPQPAPRVVAGQLTAAADRAVVDRASHARLSVVATGPVAYSADCSAPLEAVITDVADIHVASLDGPAPRGTPCGAVTLAAGQRAEYDLDWAPDPTLPSGTYHAQLTLGDQPALVLSLVLGPSPILCPGG